jgi:hypothetical protein
MIDLSNTVFELKKVVHELPMTKVFLKNGKGSVIQMKDFGTIIIGAEKIPEEDMKFIRETCFSDAPIFSAPETWRMPQILKALGAFSSASEASRNGWNFDVPIFFSEHQVRINKLKGSFCIWKAEVK